MAAGFDGTHKGMDHVLLRYERAILTFFLPRVPSWISTVHLTLMTAAWSGGIVLSGYLSRGNIRWLWAASACIVLQHVTDMLDGEIGRRRGSGLVRWGFYMDHFLDYLFLSAIVTGYSFLLPLSYGILVLVCQVVLAGFMVHAFLDFSITREFKISVRRIGPTEGRYAAIALNILLIAFGPAFLARWFPLLIVVLAAALVYVVCAAQQRYRNMDDQARAPAGAAPGPAGTQ